MRCFIALDLPQDIKTLLASVQAGLPQTKWVDPEGFHLTLAFLGDLDSLEMDQTAEALAAVEMPSFQLRLTGLERFGSGKNTRVLWAAVEPNSCLEALASNLRGKLAANAIAFDQRSFKPHVTLSRHCRAKEYQVADFFGANGGFTTPFFEVSEFHLFSSHLTASGAFYRKEMSIPLTTMTAG